MIKIGLRYAPEELQLCKELRDQGKTLQQIADRIGCAPAAVSRRLEALTDPARNLIRPKKIPCMTCKKPFPSDGPHNRLCKPCRCLSVSPYAI